MGSLAFVSNLRVEEYWSVEALECNGKICLMFVEVSRGSSSEASLGDGVATVNDLVIELGDSSSIALCLKNENIFEARFCRRLHIVLKNEMNFNGSNYVPFFHSFGSFLLFVGIINYIFCTFRLKMAPLNTKSH